MSHICISCIALFIGICEGGGVLLILNRVSARCPFHESLNWARLVQTYRDKMLSLLVAVSGLSFECSKKKLYLSVLTKIPIFPNLCFLNLYNRGLQCLKLYGKQTDNDRYWQKNNYLHTFCKKFKNV
jgi:hypothetical protein